MGEARQRDTDRDVLPMSEDVIIDLLERIAEALERIADVLEAASGQE